MSGSKLIKEKTKQAPFILNFMEHNYFKNPV